MCSARGFPVAGHYWVPHGKGNLALQVPWLVVPHAWHTMVQDYYVPGFKFSMVQCLEDLCSRVRYFPLSWWCCSCWLVVHEAVWAAELWDGRVRVTHGVVSHLMQTLVPARSSCFFSGEAAVVAAEGWLSFTAEEIILFWEMISSVDWKREGEASRSGKQEGETHTRFAVRWGLPSFITLWKWHLRIGGFWKTLGGWCPSLADSYFWSESCSKRNHCLEMTLQESSNWTVVSLKG